MNCHFQVKQIEAVQLEYGRMACDANRTLVVDDFQFVLTTLGALLRGANLEAHQLPSLMVTWTSDAPRLLAE